MLNIRFAAFKILNYVKVNWFRILMIFLLVICNWPKRFATHYPYIEGHDIYKSLIEKTTSNVTNKGKIYCEYNNIIKENRFMYREPYISNLFDGTDIRVGGEYYPPACAPKFSTAIIVPYRNREKHLSFFLTYMHNYLRKQQIHYRIFIIEQFDQKPFNRATLFNIGSIYANQYGFPCLILHDVDLMPMRLGNMYACTQRPRHMCASLDKFRFNLLYYGLFGGVVAIDMNTFQFINGMSNMV